MLQKLGITNRKPGLTQFLGIDEEQFALTPHIKAFEVLKGDVILLASDGLTDMVDETVISNVLSVEKTPARAVSGLQELALANGGVDNITIIVCRVE